MYAKNFIDSLQCDCGGHFDLSPTTSVSNPNGAFAKADVYDYGNRFALAPGHYADEIHPVYHFVLLSISAGDIIVFVCDLGQGEVTVK